MLTEEIPRSWERVASMYAQLKLAWRRHRGPEPKRTGVNERT